jgi:hypothetical protein
MHFGKAVTARTGVRRARPVKSNHYDFRGANRPLALGGFLGSKWRHAEHGEELSAVGLRLPPITQDEHTPERWGDNVAPSQPLNSDVLPGQ